LRDRVNIRIIWFLPSTYKNYIWNWVVAPDVQVQVTTNTKSASFVIPRCKYKSMDGPSPKKKAKATDLPVCPYGSKCYRNNPQHLKEFSHADDLDFCQLTKFKWVMSWEQRSVATRGLPTMDNLKKKTLNRCYSGLEISFIFAV
jgi:hypothetical protein